MKLKGVRAAMLFGEAELKMLEEGEHPVHVRCFGDADRDALDLFRGETVAVHLMRSPVLQICFVQ